MFRAPIVRILACALLCAAASAPLHAEDGIEVEADEFSLSIEFPEPMRVLANMPLTGVRVTPARPLACHWQDDVELECSVEGERSLPPATALRIDLPAGLHTATGEPLGALRLQAETERPALRGEVREWRGGLPALRVTANMRVDAAEAARVLELRSGGRVWRGLSLTPVVLRQYARERPESAFALTLPADLPADAVVELWARAGLRAQAGPLPSRTDERLTTFRYAEPFRIRGIGCRGRNGESIDRDPVDGASLDCVPDEPITLYVSAPPDAASRAAFATQLPSPMRLVRWNDNVWTPFESDRTVSAARTVAVELRLPAAHAQVALALPATLRDEAGRPLQAVPPLQLRTGAPRPAVHAPAASMLLGDPQAGVLRVVNAPSTSVGTFGVGAAPLRERRQVPQTRGALATIASAGARQRLQEGGWVTWRIDRDGGTMQMAAPQFDLAVRGGGGQLIVWALEWDDAGPVTDAAIELLLIDPQGETRTIASGRTGRDGLARLRIPDDFALPPERRGVPSPHWAVRATAGARRAVLPLGSAHGYRALPLDGEGRPRLFVVPDRPLYRAGDTLRFHGWLRQDRGGRLRLPAAKDLRLGLWSPAEYRVLETWTVALDAEGAFGGELALPSQMVDGEYCIAQEDRWDMWRGDACVFVGTFRAQDLWVEARTEAALLREGDRLTATVEAGYWSGGGASGVAVQAVRVDVQPQSPAEAYPAFAGFGFLDREQDDADEDYALRREEAAYPALDAEGRAQVATEVRFKDDEDGRPAVPAFARLELSAEVGLANREPVASNPVGAYFARFDRYVGLRLHPEWFDARTPLKLEGVVIDAAGRAQGDAPIEVEVAYLPRGEDAAPEPVTRCLLTPGTATPCDVPRTRSGRYRFTARSGDAAVAVLQRYVWNTADARDEASTLEPALRVIEAPATPEAPVRLHLRQPYARADALALIRAGDEVLDARVLAVDAAETTLTLPTAADGRNGVVIELLVRERAPSPVDANGLRRPPRMVALETAVAVPRPQRPVRVAIEADAPRAAPGQPVRIRLHNRDERPRTVALAVFDDALRALAGPRWGAFDPQGETWLGAREKAGFSPLRRFDFSGWNVRPWQMTLPWDDKPPTSGGPAPDADPVILIDRATIETSGLTALGDLLDPAGAAQRRRGETADGVDRFDGSGSDDGEDLDAVTVVGSRIVRVSEMGIADSVAVGRPEALPERGPDGRVSDAARALYGARLRRAFAETALWQPALRLAPGEIREFTLTAPDNLTRWRAVAWSADDGEDFEMAESVFEVGLPLEVRLQAPARVYPGDRAVLAANVRHGGDAPATAQASLQVEALSASRETTLPLPARGQAAFPLTIAPTDADGAPRMLDAVAAARVDTADGTAVDATAQPVELASPAIAGRKVQAGWLGADALDLGRPPLPPGAGPATVAVSLLPGADALMHGWIDDLHRYPHRCWEQMLSRAVAAAIALERGEGARFPDARATIREALENAAVFQSERGGFRYFADLPDAGYDDDGAYAPLTAYSVRALRMLQAMGHPVNPTSLAEAETYLQRQARELGDTPWARARAAFVVAAQERPLRHVVDRLWSAFADLPQPAQVATARAMVNGDHPDAAAAVSRLLAATRTRGEARVLRGAMRFDAWMSSDLREQCELIGMLLQRRGLADAATRRGLIAGLNDLYAGGIEAVDTQTGASCLMALHALEPSAARSPVQLRIDHGAGSATLTLPPDGAAQTWSAPAAGALRLTPRIEGDAPASYRVEYRYGEDARRAQSTAIGFALQREYAVLRDGRWTAVAGQTVRDGEWVRVTLRLDTGADRHFVAITDEVPGGLRPTDLALSGVAGVDVQAVSDTGSYWFRTRRLDARAPKFYAEYLPPGRHEVHYFARVGNAGDYLAPPAVAELMYGETTRARTAAQRLRIVPEAP